MTWYWTSFEPRQLHQVVKVVHHLISFVRKMSVMGCKDNIDVNIGREKEAVDQFDRDVVLKEALNPSGASQLRMKFDSSSSSDDLQERSNRYQMINNNSRRVS